MLRYLSQNAEWSNHGPKNYVSKMVGCRHFRGSFLWLVGWVQGLIYKVLASEHGKSKR